MKTILFYDACAVGLTALLMTDSSTRRFKDPSLSNSAKSLNTAIKQEVNILDDESYPKPLESRRRAKEPPKHQKINNECESEDCDDDDLLEFGSSQGINAEDFEGTPYFLVLVSCKQ